MSKSLYICYFGVREPLVRKVAELQSCGVAELQNEEVGELQNKEVAGLQSYGVAELQNERVTELQSYGVGELKKELSEQGIEWHWLRYHKRPTVPATFFDVMNGAREVRKMPPSPRTGG